MSIWSDIQKRSSGELTRKEDRMQQIHKESTFYKPYYHPATKSNYYVDYDKEMFSFPPKFKYL